MKKTQHLFLGGVFLCLMIVLYPGNVFSELSEQEIIAEINATLEDKLDLTPQQRESIQTELENQKTQRQTLSAEETAIKQSIDEELAKDVIDFDTIEDLITQLNGIRQNVLDLKVGMAANIKKVLTNEQAGVFHNIKSKYEKEEEINNDAQVLLVEDQMMMENQAQGQGVSLAFYSIECNLESDLPDWADNDPGKITKTLLDGFVMSTPCCSYSSGWAVQYGDQNASFKEGAFIGELPPESGYVTVGNTVDDQGLVKNNIDISNMSQIRTRAVMKSGYRPFTDTGDDDSSEFYCHDDIIGYDNWEWINDPKDGETYTCVLITTTDNN
jgi:Spy/CpxP family protein refolding chaperone